MVLREADENGHDRAGIDWRREEWTRLNGAARQRGAEAEGQHEVQQDQDGAAVVPGAEERRNGAGLDARGLLDDVAPVVADQGRGLVVDQAALWTSVPQVKAGAAGDPQEACLISHTQAASRRQACPRLVCVPCLAPFPFHALFPFHGPFPCLSPNPFLSPSPDPYQTSSQDGGGRTVQNHDDQKLESTSEHHRVGIPDGRGRGRDHDRTGPVPQD
jgi:hypothetical protein